MAHKDVSAPSGDESGTGSMTRLIHRAEAGDAQAQEELFERCFRVVQNLADDKLGKCLGASLMAKMWLSV